MSDHRISIWHRVGKLISHNRPDDAIALLCDEMEKCNHPKVEIAWQLNRRLRNLREKEMKGTISAKKADLEESRFCDQILILAKWVDEEENST